MQMDMGEVGLAGYQIWIIFNHFIQEDFGFLNLLGPHPNPSLICTVLGTPFQVSFVGLELLHVIYVLSHSLASSKWWLEESDMVFDQSQWHTTKS
jgi:hypothetical protein